MMFQATVPNTYAAGVASRAVWRPPQPKVSTEPELDGTHPLCECGNRRDKGKRTAYSACQRCRLLDRLLARGEDLEAIDREVLNKFSPSSEFTVTQLYEELHYVHSRYVIGRALKRLCAAGALHRKREDGGYIDGFVYVMAIEPGRSAL